MQSSACTADMSGSLPCPMLGRITGSPRGDDIAWQIPARASLAGGDNDGCDPDILHCNSLAVGKVCLS